MKNFKYVCLAICLAFTCLVLVGCSDDSPAPKKDGAVQKSLVLCVKCGELKGTPKCCKAEGREKCGGCGLLKGSIGCCKISKGATEAEVCGKCGEVKGDAKCCKAEGRTKCSKCGLFKGSAACCKLGAVKTGCSSGGCGSPACK